MAKRKKPARRKSLAKKPGGPLLAAAFFCEKIITDAQDGALVAVRILDVVTVLLPANAPPDFPSENNRMPINVSGLISFKTGTSTGNHDLRLEVESPSGKSETALQQTLQFSPEEQGGANFIMNLTVQVKSGGLFWMHVFLDGKRFTSMPIRITIQRSPT